MFDVSVSDPPAITDHRAEAKRLEREGELFGAYDAALKGLALAPDDLELKYRAVLCLASAGATRQAVSKFTDFHLRDHVDFTAPHDRLLKDIAALHARLLKDVALATPSGNDRITKLLVAAERYGAVYEWFKRTADPDAYYPGINEASLRLLAGDRELARRRAREIANELGNRPPDGRSYYEIVTAMEALLILEQGQLAGAALSAALAAQGDAIDFRARAGTVRQLRLVGSAARQEIGWLDELAPPRVIHYAGHMIAPPGGSGRLRDTEESAIALRIKQALGQRRVGFGFGSLAAGADILFAEALLARGAELNICLPFDQAEFVALSVRPSGAGWVDRFQACLARAASVRFATKDASLGDDRLFSYCSQLAMGLALLRARHLSAPVEQILVWDGGPRTGEAGTADAAARWARGPRAQTVIPCGQPRALAAAAAPTGDRRTRAMLFGDIKGFSKLSDRELPRFTESVLGRFAGVLDRLADKPDFVNTWGDGLFAVFADAGQAAECALQLQEEMAELDLQAAGLPGHLKLRLGGHLGPVFPTYDPVLKRENFFGAHVSQAARIEPVTPINCVYVTEPFAAVLELYNADAFTCDYVGLTKTAKEWGILPMFLLRRNVRAS